MVMYQRQNQHLQEVCFKNCNDQKDEPAKKKLDSRRFPESNAPLFFELRQILDLL